MKVSIVYDNMLISSKITSGVKIRDFLSNLKTSPSMKNILKKEVRLMDENYNFVNEEDILKVVENIEKKFYLITKNIYRAKKLPISDENNLPIDELITKVTEGKLKLKKQKVAKKLYSGGDSRIQLIQQLANNFSQLPNIPGIQNRVNEINHFTNLLRTMINDEILSGEVGRERRPQQAEQIQIVPDENMLRQLKDMGFPEDNCRRALVLARNNISRATDLLINDELDYIQNEV